MSTTIDTNAQGPTGAEPNEPDTYRGTKRVDFPTAPATICEGEEDGSTLGIDRKSQVGNIN